MKPEQLEIEPTSARSTEAEGGRQEAPHHATPEQASSRAASQAQTATIASSRDGEPPGDHLCNSQMPHAAETHPLRRSDQGKRLLAAIAFNMRRWPAIAA